MLSAYSAYLYAPFFTYPGKFSDLINEEELSALVLTDITGAVCGMISWLQDSARAVRFYGPYVFSADHQTDIATRLVDDFIGRVARSSANIAFTTQATDALPMDRFELLGTLDYCTGSGECTVLKSFYYHLREDHGLAVWSHPEQFLVGNGSTEVIAALSRHYAGQATTLSRPTRPLQSTNGLLNSPVSRHG